MPRQQIIIIVIAVIAVVVLYQLPKVVVENDPEATFQDQTGSGQADFHEIDLPDSVIRQIDSLRELLVNSNSKEKSFTFADSLARAFLVYNELDSASKYAAELEELADTPEMMEKVGDFYYSAFSLSGNQSITITFAEKTREYYQPLTDAGDRPDLDIRTAMTLVSGANPMEGILKLRELADLYPDNREVQYNLGLLSIRSGQYDRAIQRFNALVELEPDNIEGYFYLGVSHLEQGNTDKAKEYFDLVAKEGKDPAIVKLVEDYLSEIN